MRLAGVTVLIFAGACLAQAEEKPPAEIPLRQPSVASLFPLSVQTGGQAIVEFRGNYLDRVQGIRCECADLTAKVLSSSPLGITAEIHASESAPPGPRFLFVETPKGPSARLLFRVTGWQSVVEQEPNDGAAGAQEVSIPAMIEGRIRTVHDSDMFQFHARAGERLAFNVLTGRSRAPGHVSAILIDSQGRELAHNLSYFGTDPYLDYMFEKEGDYILTIVPRRFSDFYTVVADDQEINWQYELAIGRSPILWSLFPMGGLRGSRVEAELRADFLDAAATPAFSGKGVSATLDPVSDPCGCRFKLTVDVAADAALGPRYLTVPDKSGALMPLAFVVGDVPELLESEPNDALDVAQPIKLPVVINGKIGERGDRDGYRFTVDQFDAVTFEVDAHGLGSHVTDPNLTLARPDGEIKNAGDDRCTKCGSFYSNIRKKELLDSKFWHYFQEGNPNDADAAGDYVLQLRDNSKRGGQHHTYRLTLRTRKPDFRVGVGTDGVRAAIGGVAKIPVAISSEEGFSEQVEITVADLPAGLRAKPLWLRPDDPEGVLEVEHDPAVLPPSENSGWVQKEIQIVGAAKIGDEKVSRIAELPSFFTEDGAGYNETPREALLLSFVEPAYFSLSVEVPFRGFRMYLTKDPRVEVPVEIQKGEAFTEPLSWSGIEFPDGLRIADVQPLENGKVGVVLSGDPAKLGPGRYALALRATGSHEGREITEVTQGIALRVN